MDKTALFRFTYGLYVLTTRTAKDNGCIVDAVMQLTDEPLRLAVCVNRNHLTNEMMKESGKFNLSVITKDADVEIFKNFGYQSGKDTDKFQNYKHVKRSENGICYITEGTNTYVECRIIGTQEFETHTLFIAAIQEAVKLNDALSITYSEYRERL